MTVPNHAILGVSNLAYAVRGKKILSEVSFVMRRGEIRSVIGPNGAGKSTLARCISGMAVKSAGSVMVAGREQSEMGRRQLARHICYMPQIQGDSPAFTVRDFVGMGRYAHTGLWHGYKSDDPAKIAEAMRLAGVDQLADRLLPTLSGGERQMVAIAAGVAQEAELLILDEPTTFLDPGHQDMLIRLVRRLNGERGISLLIVTHDINMAMFFTHRVLALRDGRMVFDGESKKLAEPDILEMIYGMQFALLPAGTPGRSLAIAASLTEPDLWM